MKKILKRVLKVVGIILVILILLLAALLIKVVFDQKKNAADQEAMIKTDEELIGTRFSVPRDGKDVVSVNLYIPDSSDKTPVVFNIHGGAFVGGNADALDTQSDRISREWNAAVITIQYKLATNGITIEYAVDEVVDTVKYFMEHAVEYNIDTNQIVLMGYSAGGYHALAAAMNLKMQNIDVAAQVLCYPFIRDAVEIYNQLTDEQKHSLAPALFILADNDPISDGSGTYEDALRKNGIMTDIKKYDRSIHGFIEENNPEYENLNSKQSKSPEQEAMAQDAEQYIHEWLKNLLG